MMANGSIRDRRQSVGWETGFFRRPAHSGRLKKPAQGRLGILEYTSRCWFEYGNGLDGTVCNWIANLLQGPEFYRFEMTKPALYYDDGVFPPHRQEAHQLPLLRFPLLQVWLFRHGYR